MADLIVLVLWVIAAELAVVIGLLGWLAFGTHVVNLDVDFIRLFRDGRD